MDSIWRPREREFPWNAELLLFVGEQKHLISIWNLVFNWFFCLPSGLATITITSVNIIVQSRNCDRYRKKWKWVKKTIYFLKDVSATGTSASEQSELCIFLKDISALCARKKYKCRRRKRKWAKHTLFFFKDTSAVLKSQEPQAPQAQVEVSKAKSVFSIAGAKERLQAPHMRDCLRAPQALQNDYSAVLTKTNTGVSKPGGQTCTGIGFCKQSYQYAT